MAYVPHTVDSVLKMFQNWEIWVKVDEMTTIGKYNDSWSALQNQLNALLRMFFAFFFFFAQLLVRCDTTITSTSE